MFCQCTIIITKESQASLFKLFLRNVLLNSIKEVKLLKHPLTYLKAKAVLKFIEAISEKTLRSTVALTAARGRGKSAALGLAIAGAVAFGYVAQ